MNFFYSSTFPQQHIARANAMVTSKKLNHKTKINHKTKNKSTNERNINSQSRGDESFHTQKKQTSPPHTTTKMGLKVHKPSIYILFYKQWFMVRTGLSLRRAATPLCQASFKQKPLPSVVVQHFRIYLCSLRRVIGFVVVSV